MKCFGRGNLKETDHLGNLFINWQIILKWTLKKEDGRLRTEFLSFTIGTSGGGVALVKMVINLSVP
jgi:hypothetical protein